MTVLAFEGFENGVSAAAATNENFNAASGTYSIQGTTKRSGDFALRTNPTTTAIGYLGIGATAGDGSARATNLNVAILFTRFYFRIGTLPAASNEPFVSFLHTGGNSKAELRLNTAGNILIYDANGTLRTTSSGTLSTGVWYRIEVFCSTDDSLASSSNPVEVKVDGTIFVTATGSLNTANFAKVLFGKTANRNGQTVDFYYDDIVIDDGQYPGPGLVLRLDVAANTSDAAWSGGTSSSDYNEIDETPADGNTSYIATSAATTKSMFTVESIVAAGGPSDGWIGAVRVQTVIERTTGNAASTRARLEFGSAGVETTGAAATNGTYQEYDLLSTTRPNDYAEWQHDDFATVTIGINENTSTSQVRCTAIRAYVDIRDALTAEDGGYVKVGTITTPTSNGRQSITGLGFRPKVIMIFGYGVSDTGNNSHMFSTFAAVNKRDGRRFCFQSRWQDNVAANAGSVIGGRADSSHFIYLRDNSSNRGVAWFLEMTADGFELFWEVTSIGAEKLFYLAFGGDDVDATCEQFATGTGTGNHSYTGAKMTPDLLIFATSPNAEGTYNNCPGFGVARSTSERWAHTMYGLGATTPTKEKSKQRTDQCLLTNQNGTILFAADLVSMDANGFTLNYANLLAGNGPCGYVAIKGITAKAGSFNTPTSIGNAAISGLGFEPDFVLLNSHGFASGTSEQSDARRFTGLITATDVRAISATGTHNVSTTERDTYLSDTQAFVGQDSHATPTTLLAADYVSLDADGFTLDWTTVQGTAREVCYLAIKMPDAAVVVGAHQGDILLLGVG